VYNLAFTASRGVNYGFAAAITIIIFFIVGAITLLQFRYTRMWEEVGKCLVTSVLGYAHPSRQRRFSIGIRLFVAAPDLFSVFPIIWLISASITPPARCHQTLIPKNGGLEIIVNCWLQEFSEWNRNSLKISRSPQCSLSSPR
jgi:hypothetical protein